MFKVEKTTREITTEFPSIGVQGFNCCNGASMMICSVQTAIV